MTAESTGARPADDVVLDPPVVAADTVAVVHLPAEVDLSTAPEIRDELMASLNRCPHLVVDATDVRFMDSSGVNALIRAKERADRLDGSIHVVTHTRQVLRLLAMTQLSRTLGVVDGVDGARDCAMDGSPGHSCSPSEADGSLPAT